MVIYFDDEDAGRFIHQSVTLERLEKAKGDITLRMGKPDFTVNSLSIVLEFVKRAKMQKQTVSIEASPLKAAVLRSVGVGRLAKIIESETVCSQTRPYTKEYITL